MFLFFLQPLPPTAPALHHEGTIHKAILGLPLLWQMPCAHSCHTAQPESEDCNAVLACLAAVRSTLAELQYELEAYGACDLVKVEEKRRAVVLAREAALHPTGKGITRSCHKASYLRTAEADLMTVQTTAQF
jgi:hypothetical protein